MVTMCNVQKAMHTYKKEIKIMKSCLQLYNAIISNIKLFTAINFFQKTHDKKQSTHSDNKY